MSIRTTPPRHARLLRRVLAVASLLCAAGALVPSVATAHVTVWPRSAARGAFERYVVRVPNEQKVPCTSVELEVPPGVTVRELLAPAGWKYDVRKDGDRIVAITFTMEIKPGEFAEYPLIAVNPKDAAEIAWKAHQHYADGRTFDWVGPAGSRQPASVVKLTGSEASKEAVKDETAEHAESAESDLSMVSER